jgi:hypothetical protein
VLQFADPMIEAREVARVLRPGAVYLLPTGGG